MKRLSLIILILLVGIIGGYGIAMLNLWPDQTDSEQQSTESGPKILYWVAPMDPNYRRDGPGKSPMGMDLVPVYEEEPGAEAPEGSISIDPSVVNNIGVRTAEVEVASMRPPIRTVGRIVYDEERVARIHVRSSGWIERLIVRSEGEMVKQGDLLFEIYSPDLVNAQAEFLQALQSGRADLIEASRERLRALDIANSQIAEIERARKTQQYVRVYAPVDGTVTVLNVAEGQFVKPDTQIVTLADTSVVWLVSDVFETNVGQVRIGAVVKAQSKFEPGNEVSGTVDYIYPDLDLVTRTVPVRTVLRNKDGKLKPGMFMTVVIESPPRPKTTVIPREALIRTGKEERVILSLGDGRFQPAAVVSGMEAYGRVEILSGLKAGEMVVASGQFLIDSESSFAGASLRLQPPKEHSLSAEAEGIGTLKSISKDKRSINLSHEPIDSLGWPAMTMDMELAPGVSVEGIESGDDIKFSVGRNREGMYVITSMRATTKRPDRSVQTNENAILQENNQPRDHSRHRMDAGETTSKLVQATGVLREISVSNGTVKLKHDPIPELGWPAMTMNLPVSDDVDLSALKPGDRIRFSIGQADGSGYVIHKVDVEP